MTSIYKRPLPTDTWLINKLIEQSTLALRARRMRRARTEGYKIIAELDKKEKVIIKVSMDQPDKYSKGNNEYYIYKLLEKLGKSQPNIPSIYGVMTCYEKRENIDNLFRLTGKGLCYGEKDKHSSKIYLTIMENIKHGSTIDTFRRLNKMETLSVIWQGLFQMYVMYYIFGILHNDYNASNILLYDTRTPFVEYNIVSFPFRYYKFDIGNEEANQDYNTYKIPTYGVKLKLIDFDQAKCYHHNHINVDRVSDHVIKHAFDFIEVVCKYGDNDVYVICKQHFDTKGKHLIDYCIKFFERYNKERDEISNELFIDKTRVTFRMWMKQLKYKFPELEAHFVNMDLC